jgi:hypothetical protein
MSQNRLNLGLPERALIGMVHVGALPGTPMASRGVDELAEQAAGEARVLAESGFDGIIVENMHDRPYVLAPHGPEVVSAMTRVTLAVRAAAPRLPLGVQVLSSGEKEALAVALAAGAQFVRCENFVYAHVADEGLLDRACAGPLLRYRRAIGAERVKLVCDIKKKHASHAITADVDLEHCAKEAEFFGADGVIVSGAHTGMKTSAGDVALARKGCGLPVLAGSGVTPGDVGELLAHADALIVGTFIKQGGVWSHPVDPARCAEVVRARDASGGPKF